MLHDEIQNMSYEEFCYNVVPFLKNPGISSNRIFREILTRKDVNRFLNEYIIFLFSCPEFYRYLFAPEHEDIFEHIVKENEDLIIESMCDFYVPDYIFYFSKTYPEILLKNITKILDKSNNYVEILNELTNSPVNRELFTKYGDLIIRKTLEGMIKNPVSTFLFFEYFLEVQSEEFINDNAGKILVILDTLINSVDGTCYDREEDHCADIITGLGMGAKKCDIINEFLMNNKDFIVSMFTGKSIEFLKEKDIEFVKESPILDFFIASLDDAMRMEKTDFGSVSAFSGATSMSLIVGNKVLKVGYKEIIDIPYDKRILQPLIRTEITGIPNYKEQDMLFEVYERVDTENITNDDAYFVFKDMLERGKLWADTRYNNVGRLLKDNIPYTEGAVIVKDGKIASDKYYVDDAVVHIIPGDEKEILKAGELVVLDLEYVYDIKDFNITEYIEEKLLTDTDFKVGDVISALDKRYHMQIYDYIEYMARYMGEVKEKLGMKKASI